MIKSIFLEEPIQFEAMPATNPMISPVNIRIAYAGANRNGSYIDKQVLQSAALASLPNCPIVGYYAEERQDYADHVQEVGFDRQTGQTKMIRKTQAYGVVPADTKVWWEEVNGVEYMHCQGYLWTQRHPEALRVLSGENNQSMELDPQLTRGEWVRNPNGRGQVFNITETYFSALCILGAEVDPAFEEAKIVSALDYSLKKDNDFQKEWGEFMKDLSFALDEKLLLMEQDDNEDEEIVGEVIVKLDVVADNLAAQGLEKPTVALDDIITELLLAEDEREVEDKLVITDAVSDALKQQLPEDADEVDVDEVIIVSDPKVGKAVFSTAPTIVKGYKEVEEMPQNIEDLKNEKAQVETQEQVAPPAPAAPAVPQEENMAVPPKPEEAPPAPAPAPGMEQPPAQPGMEQPGMPVQREGLDDKKKAMDLAKYSDEELLGHLMNRIQSAERAKEMLGAMAKPEPVQEAPAPTEQPMEGETQEAPPAPEGQPEGGQAPTEAPPAQEGEGNGEENKEAPPAPAEETPPAKEEAPKEAPATPVEKTEAPAEDKEKKKEFSIETYQKAIVKLKNDFQAKVDELETAKQENETLRNFKLSIERKEKESMLGNFSLLGDDFLTDLRNNLDGHTLDQIEAKCSVEMVRKGLAFGQKAPKEEAILSFSNEGSKSEVEGPSWLSAVDAIRANKSSKRR